MLFRHLMHGRMGYCAPTLLDWIVTSIWSAALSTIGMAISSTCLAQDNYYRYESSNNSVIVFVHGVLGDAKLTWKNKESGAYWPDLISKDSAFDGVNIYILDYPSTVFERNSSISELANDMRLAFEGDKVVAHKDIYIVAHSMGGLVVRDFITKYRSGDYLYAQKVRMVHFFGTPTEGSPYAALAAIVSKNPQFGKLMPMKVADGYLADLLRNWHSTGLKIRSFCAYEQKSTFGIMVVDFRSASNGCTEPLDGLNTDHLGLVKPSRIDAARGPYASFLNAFLKVSRSRQKEPNPPVEPSASGARPAPTNSSNELVRPNEARALNQKMPSGSPPSALPQMPVAAPQGIPSGYFGRYEAWMKGLFTSNLEIIEKARLMARNPAVDPLELNTSHPYFEFAFSGMNGSLPPHLELIKGNGEQIVLHINRSWRDLRDDEVAIVAETYIHDSLIDLYRSRGFQVDQYARLLKWSVRFNLGTKRFRPL